MVLTEKTARSGAGWRIKESHILTVGRVPANRPPCARWLMVLRKRNIDVALAAPTGRAAKRLTGGYWSGRLQAKNAAPLGGVRAARQHLSRNEENPYHTGLSSSMKYRWSIFCSSINLLKALPPDAQPLAVGDADQLPPVGPGNVLRDLLRSEAIPTVRLTELFRPGAAKPDCCQCAPHQCRANAVTQREQKNRFLLHFRR